MFVFPFEEKMFYLYLVLTKLRKSNFKFYLEKICNNISEFQLFIVKHRFLHRFFKYFKSKCIFKTLFKKIKSFPTFITRDVDATEIKITY